MTATVSLPGHADGIDHMSYLDRLRMRLHCRRLDQRLAAGADPDEDPELRRRAEELTHGRRRLRMAAVLDRMLAEAEGPAAPFESKSPLARAAIRDCDPEIARIVDLLGGGEEVDPRGVAHLALLLREGSSPFYTPSTAAPDLRADLAEVTAELAPAPSDP